MSEQDVQNIYSIEPLVYIAGILVPTNSIRVQTAFNSMPTATISIPPYPQLQGIGRQDRVPVQIFIKDTFADTEEFILLFEGEIKSSGYVSSAMSREFIINAQCSLSFLMDVKVFFMHSTSDMSNQKIIPQEKIRGLWSFDSDVTFPASFFMYGFTPISEKEGEKIKVPYEFLENVYTFVGNAGSMNEYNDSALADFYSDYTEKIKLMDKLVKVPEFDD
ncbi:MAG: hypothetical protein ACOC1X_03415, partial [Promethearchaeota archaeon]